MTESEVRTDTQCLLCKTTVNTRSARVHLRKCLGEQPVPDSGDKTPPLLISAHGDHPDRKNAYVLYAVCRGNATLMSLDLFIRAHWLECCAHLSRFIQQDREFQCPEWGKAELDIRNGILSMNHPIASVITPGSDVRYEYDMGSTTHLTVRAETAPSQATTWLQQQDPDSVISLIAQNLIPERCDNCGETATSANGNEYSCTNCPHDPRSYRPLVNSPRDGVDCFDGPDLNLLDHLCRARARSYHPFPA